MNPSKVKPEEVEIIEIDGSDWNCDKCIFFKSESCECMAVKRLLFSQVLNDDCNDCKRPFVLKTLYCPECEGGIIVNGETTCKDCKDAPFTSFNL